MVIVYIGLSILLIWNILLTIFVIRFFMDRGDVYLWKISFDNEGAWLIKQYPYNSTGSRIIKWPWYKEE